MEDGAFYGQPHSEPVEQGETDARLGVGGRRFGTTARKVDGGYVVNGRKFFVSLAGCAPYYATPAIRLGDEPWIERTLYLQVPKDASGVSFPGEWDPMGMRATVSRDMVLEDLFVPDAAEVLPPGLFGAMYNAFPHLVLSFSATFLGLMQAAWDAALACLTGRMPGAPAPHTEIAAKGHAIAEMLFAIESARALYYRAISAAEVNPPPEAVQRARAAHVTVQRAVVTVTQEAIRVCGGRTFLRRYPLERYARDARAAALMRQWTEEIATQQAWEAALGLDAQGAAAGASATSVGCQKDGAALPPMNLTPRVDIVASPQEQQPRPVYCEPALDLCHLAASLPVRPRRWRTPQHNSVIHLPQRDRIGQICDNTCSMLIARFSILPAIVLSFISAIVALAAPAQESAPVQLRIEVYGFAGFHVLTNRTSVAASGGRYSIATDLDTRGIASVFVDLNSHSEVRGRLTHDAVHPDAYLGDVRRNGSDRHYRIDYHADGTVASDQTPPSAALRSSGAVEQIKGTVDQLTAFFILERQLAQHGSCGLVVPVFDGLSRYNLRFTDARAETLSPAGPQNFAGPTVACNISREDIAGFPANQDANGGTYKRGKIWYARIAGGDQMVPVRMEFDTEYGIVEGYLAELRARGVDLRFID